MSRPEIAVLIPVLGRPHRVQPLIDSLKQSGAPATPYFIVNASDSDELAAIRASGAAHFIVEPISWSCKINEGYRRTREPWMLLAADDVRFLPDWYDEVLPMLDTPGVIGTYEMGQPRPDYQVSSPHPLVARAYADEHGTIDGKGAIAHEGYRHYAVDTEICWTAVRRGLWRFQNRCRIEHLHPQFGKAPADSTYLLGSQTREKDRAHFLARLPRIVRAGSHLPRFAIYTALYNPALQLDHASPVIDVEMHVFAKEKPASTGQWVVHQSPPQASQHGQSTLWHVAHPELSLPQYDYTLWVHPTLRVSSLFFPVMVLDTLGPSGCSYTPFPGQRAPLCLLRDSRREAQLQANADWYDRTVADPLRSHEHFTFSHLKAQISPTNIPWKLPHAPYQLSGPEPTEDASAAPAPAPPQTAAPSPQAATRLEMLALLAAGHRHFYVPAAPAASLEMLSFLHGNLFWRAEKNVGGWLRLARVF
jgi:hypothetical protein